MAFTPLPRCPIHQYRRPFAGGVPCLNLITAGPILLLDCHACFTRTRPSLLDGCRSKALLGGRFKLPRLLSCHFHDVPILGESKWVRRGRWDKRES